MQPNSFSGTNPTLIGRLRQDPGNHAARGEFVKRYTPRIYGWCRRRRPDRALAPARSTTLSGRLRLLLSATGLPEDVAAALRQRFGYGNLSEASGTPPSSSSP